jgi:AraC family transcriptional regulator
MSKSPEDPERLLPLLIDVQRDLEQDLSLSSLAARFGTSKYHFHRLFASAVGETPKRHFERLRLERAAMLLATTGVSVTDLGVELGFKNVETFSRRFKSALGYSPTGYRRMAKEAQRERLKSVDFHASDEYALSRATFESLPPLHLLAIRHLGDYGKLNESFGEGEHLWGEIVASARSSGVAIDPVFMAIVYDDPTMTPEPQRRCDVCVPVHARVETAGRARGIEFAGGLHAIARYVGPIGHLLSAFRGLADEIRRSVRYEFRTGYPLEFLRESNVGGRRGVHHIDVCFPVARVRR